MQALFPVTIFLSAFLLFQVQPMMGRYILPWFGGTPAVWSVCLLFFQFALLGGYAYAHWIGAIRNTRRQAAIHSTLLAASLLLLPIMPSAERWSGGSTQHPQGAILLLLTATIGGPYFLLSTTAPLLQRWFHLTYPARSPWRLYALSNAGSLLALLSYPILMEPFLRMRTQGWMWTSAYIAFAALGAITAWRSARVVGSVREDGHSGAWDEAAPAGIPPLEPAPAAPVQADIAQAVDSTPATVEAAPLGRPSPWTIAFWLALAATGSALLLATTNLITQDIASAPFLWIAPLATYLLTFILAFEHDRWYHRLTFAVLAGIFAPVAAATTGAGILLPIWGEAGIYVAALFAACMVCHGELRKARPAERHLTAFYLCVSAGGVAGGVFVALIAPTIFHEFTEYPLALIAACILGIAGWMRTGAYAQWTRSNFAIRIPLMALLFGALGASALAIIPGRTRPLETARNFFGILRVVRQTDEIGAYRQLSHGRIKHGSQYLEGEFHDKPVSYYGPHSGVAVVMNALDDAPRRIGVVGLGTGTMAAWGRAGDAVTFYEINPEVERIAHQWFTYLEDSPAKVSVVLGDARIQMARELAEGHRHDYDVIVVDAFSSDAIPVHLLTEECADIYNQRLKPGGKMLIHISNRSLNLEPVVRGMAGHLGFRAAQLLSSGYASTGEDASDWVLLTADGAFTDQPKIKYLTSGWTPGEPLLWTDDFSSLWHVLRW